ncbi:Cytochrome c family profile [Acididesulfobacillus acetoxydans]|uniref:Cytochrome b6 n=1 Tax=Acididesulfobacillus acetoxydans TaxID=1561005 RepID=A0A8S0X3C9_9FIRM|nr:cytochrome b N-terminal domain-containing protein [Acididesulfobacillus acetoxydans]CAA7599980.1 Cytochrome c family profile [Acididesulfobacillus acetoxydans]CEJ05973.1 Cytochrome b6 [Acididesulfobacillus acetoxydans]
MGRWLDERLQFSDLLRSVFEHPIPKPSNFLDYLGFATLFAFASQAITGILLATAYIPSAAEAYNSIKALQAVTLGSYVRSLHSWGANFMVVLVFLHLLRVFYEGAYKKPRELTWIMGVILFLATLGLAFTGYLLPWNQEGYWATTVGSAMPGYIPLIGEYILRIMRNGLEVTGATLTRFYAVHMLVLPLIILLAFTPHFFFVLRQGMSVADKLEAAKQRGEDIEAKSIPFYPNVALRMILLVLVVAAALWILAGVYPKSLGSPADPLNRNHYVPTPAWYFFGVYQALKYFPGRLDVIAMVGLPFLLLIVLFGLPWIDRNPSRSPRKRPLALSIAAVLVVGLSFLTYQGIRSVPKPLPTTGVIAAPSYKADIDPIFQSRCVGCHGQSGGYSLDTYANVMKKNVVPGHPNASLLVKRIEGKVAPQMPLGLQPLSKDQIQTVKNWIKAGAKNN